MIRKAKIGDVRAIHGLLSAFGDRNLLLPRSLSELYDHLRDFTVYEDEAGAVGGVAALHICWEDLAEIRSLAVREDLQHHGVGRRLVEHCLSEAVTLGIYRVFTLTNRPEFFKKLGFGPVDKATLPHKVWADCVKCARFPDCDEVALLLEL
ncbi:N-acetyltransferase [Dissulfurirhabdus thermomarina]|uniref:N-acetyltransferase n=1 Tax=Dissulfurirhabdus thermomarina TaxID=1765737 RepID=A0A6N9TSK1_DISTH|nr:N-acetyltransferase [Dissulfurirhabdus thermomarina]NDY43063.1 N-acetyltransferase [Dissulfurirhabdus thermomarina]NMX22391.1 N-acetyltransferase [Dissulfurirhabdus thermomarina]